MTLLPCKKCGETIDEAFDSCWKCLTPKGQEPPPGSPSPPPRRRLAYKFFRSSMASWTELFNQAAQFATEVGREQVLGISHSCDEDDGVVTVWYWTTEDEVKTD